MPGLGTSTDLLAGTQRSGRYALDYTRPEESGLPILGAAGRAAKPRRVGAVALDSPRTLVGCRDQIDPPPQIGFTGEAGKVPAARADRPPRAHRPGRPGNRRPPGIVGAPGG
ncbi:hypothetical protein [Kitasatospora sp. NPDC017646]|uniref:hypothetical protein n=1 Tax=Kitasatospora sp. NPDC017646 TaxID=3364024 RepID=UPI003794DFDB